MQKDIYLDEMDRDWTVGLSKSEVIRDLQNGLWKERAQYCDGICAYLLSENHENVWQNLEEDLKDTSNFNATSYSNIAAMVVYGEKFPERHEKIQYIKNWIKSVK